MSLLTNGRLHPLMSRMADAAGFGAGYQNVALEAK
jgi:hypothetical protein